MRFSPRILTLLFWGGVIASPDGREYIPSAEEVREQTEALSLARTEIEKLRTEEPAYAALRLGKIMWKTTRKNLYQVDERLEVYRLAKEALMAIPDHAGYYAKHLESKREEMLEEVRSGGGRVSYDRERDLCFSILRQIPTPNAVQVLGEFLQDDRDQLSLEELLNNAADGRTNSMMAAGALGELIENPPVKTHPRSYGKADIETWKLWYAQVKAGNREFQFKGDDRVYRMDEKGETPKGHPKELVVESPRPAAENPASSPQTTVSKLEGVNWPLIIVSVLLATTGAWLAFLKPQKRN